MKGKRSVITRIARWSAVHPWLAIGLWLAFVAAAFLLGGTGTRMATDAELTVGEAGRAAHMVEQGGLADPATENVLVTAKPNTGTLDKKVALKAAEDAAARLDRLPGVDKVGEPIPARDGSAVLVRTTMRGDIDTADERVEPLMNEVAKVQSGYPALRVELVGDATIQRGFGEMLDNDLNKATGFSVPLTLVIMLVAFGAIVAAGVPVLLALSAVAAGLGLWGLASQLVPDPGMVSHVIVLMGMAVGVDYSLFYLKREREERARGKSKIDAVEIAADTSGHSVVVSGIAVVVSMAGLYLSGDLVFSAMATGAILVVAVAMLASLTILPALLAKLGNLLERPRVPLVWRITNRGGRPKLWSALLRPALRFPLPAFLAAAGILVALAIPALDLSIKSTAIDDFPRSIPAMRGYDRLVKAFPSEGNAHVVAVEAPAGQAPKVRQALDDLVTRTSGDPLFARGQQADVRTSPDNRISVVSVATPYGTDSKQAKDSLTKLRTTYVPDALRGVTGEKHAVGGDVAANADYTGNLSHKLPWVIGFALLLTIVMMAVAFKSIVVAIVTMVLNGLSAAASFGLLAWVFQNSWAENLLGFESTGHVVAWVPALLFVVLLGLSMDYHVFVVSRIRELAASGMSTRDAVSEGITRTAGVVTSAAIVMVLVFSLFASMSFIELKQVGVGLTAAILIDATIIRIVALPAIINLLGRFTWWPSRSLSKQPEPVYATIEPEAEELEDHSAGETVPFRVRTVARTGFPSDAPAASRPRFPVARDGSTGFPPRARTTSRAGFPPGRRAEDLAGFPPRRRAADRAGFPPRRGEDSAEG
ncbi:MMPL family transporter [Nonomuraea sp. B12E4]|uniref:MMPL family transporter n=1 Tax=Nonomuraea sp. B12E4 TaxID=3153564 RepID=UPI00325F6427